MRIETNKSTVIVAPKKELTEIVRKFTGVTSRRHNPWNIMWINQDINQALESFKPVLCNSHSEGSKKFLIVLQNADEIHDAGKKNLVRALRVARHHGLSYVLGYRSINDIPDEVAALARINAFPIKSKPKITKQIKEHRP